MKQHDPFLPLKAALKFIVIISISTLLILSVWKIYTVLGGGTSFSFEEKRNFMGTVLEIKAYGKNARSASKQALKEMEHLTNLLSIYSPKSEVSLINSMAGIAPVAVSRITFDVINRSVILSRSVDRTFDITAGPLIDLWNFKGIENFSPPSPFRIRDTLKYVDYRKIEIDPELETVKLPKRGMKLNLGGVGKGFALAKARSVLVANGITSALLSMGSSITCIGKNPDGNLWRIGIKSPRKPLTIIGVVPLAPGQAMSTSGDYEQFIEINGKRYHHIINPVTGYPATDCRSVTIIAGDATAADILSTAVFIMGPWRGIRLLNSLEKVEGLIIDSNGKIHKTSEFILEEPKVKEEN